MEGNMETLSSLASTVIGKVLIWIITALVAVIIGMGGWVYILKADVKVANSAIEKAQVNKELDELQKEALRSAILDQSDAVDKQRVDAVKKLETFKTAQYTIIQKYERERIAVRDLNGSIECDAMREIIRSAL